MLSSFNVAVPANTTALAPLDTKVVLPVGTITQIRVQFPSGCANLVRVRLLQGGHQLWPRDEDQDIRGDGVTIPWAETYEVLLGLQNFVIRIANTDDTYPHTISVYFEVDEPAVPAARSAPNAVDRLRSIFTP